MSPHAEHGTPVSTTPASGTIGTRRGDARRRVPWLRLSAATAARVLLVSWVCLSLWAAMPALIGWEPTTVMTGSMEPAIRAGDVVIARPTSAADARLSQVLLVQDPDHEGRLRLHRFVSRAEDGRLVLRGDANQADDSSPVAPEAVEGVGVLRVPYVGLPLLWAHQGRWGSLVLLLVGILLLGAATRVDRGLCGASRSQDSDEQDDDPSDDGRYDDHGRDDDHEGPPGSGLREEHPTLRAGSQAVPVAGQARPQVGVWSWRWSSVAPHRGRRARLGAFGAGVLLLTSVATIEAAGPAGATFSRASTNHVNTLAAAPYFTCKAAVLAANPYLYYQFNNPTMLVGGIADSSGNGRNGSVYGGSIAVNANSGPCTGEQVKSLQMDRAGDNGFVSSPSFLLTPIVSPQVFTIQIWFRTTTKEGRLIGFSSSRIAAISANRDRQLYMDNDGKIAFGVYTNVATDKVVSSPLGKSYADGQWHLAAATRSASQMRLYLDGALVGSTTSATTYADYSGYWRIGFDDMTEWPNTGTGQFAGAVDDAAVYTTELTAAQIAAIYAAR